LLSLCTITLITTLSLCLRHLDHHHLFLSRRLPPSNYTSSRSRTTPVFLCSHHLDHHPFSLRASPSSPPSLFTG
jgi:hypothetical protein